MNEFTLSSGRVVKWQVRPAGRSRSATGAQRDQLDIHYGHLHEDEGEMIHVSDEEKLEAVTTINAAIHGEMPQIGAL